MVISLLFRVQYNLIRERVGIAGGDRGYMVLIPVYDGHYLHRCLVQ